MEDIKTRSHLPALLALLIAVALFTGLASPARAGSVDSAAIRQKIDLSAYAHLQQQALEQGRVRLIVRLDVPVDPQTMALGKAEAFSQQQAIDTAQARVESALATLDAEVLYDYEYIPFNLVSVNAEALDVLLSLPVVKGVEEDKLSRADLMDSVPLINADDAWNAGYTGAGQVVAVLDTGVDKNHAFLQNKVVSEACYSTNSSSYPSSISICPGGVTQTTAVNSALPYAGACPSGECDHGTHVAGIAAGKGTNFSGVARDASIIAIQVFSRFNNFPEAGCTPAYPCALTWDSDQLKGLERVYALRTSFNIAAVNLSIGGSTKQTTPCDGDARKAIIDSLRAAGIATVISAGNNGFTNGISSPACISSAVSVGATTKWDTVASYSNSASLVSLLAPGSSIASSIPGGSYEYWSGTSMAAPHVAGAWAVIKSVKPGASVTEVLDALTTTGIPILDSRNSITKPRIDVYAAVTVFRVPAPPSGLTTAVTSGAAIDLTWVDNSENETGFSIERRLPGGTWQEAGQAAANSTTYQDASAPCETSLEYRVRAFNANGLSAPSNVQSTAAPICPPGSLSATGTQQRITLSWVDRSALESGYRVEVSPNGITGWTQAGDLPTNSTVFVLYPLACGSAASYYRVTAYNASNAASSVTVGQATLACATPPRPSGVSVEPLSITALQVSWTDVGDFETGYTIQRSPDGIQPYVAIGSVGRDVTTYADMSLPRAGNFYYRIVATNALYTPAPNSTPSPPASASTYPYGAHLPLIVQ